ncbi:MAG: T9SS type A sorting domain-containing protein [Candidatus Eiseniibacteriota bacterium]
MKHLAIVLIAGPLLASPASAQWTRVDQVPIANMYTVWTRGDTIAAASDSTVLLSTDAGMTWSTSATVAAGATTVEAVRIHRGRLYAGTFGQGVFVSSDMGASWQSFNQGLVGGFADTQLRVMDLLGRGDTLYAATAGAGAWIRNLASVSGWSHYGSGLEPAQASNVNALAASDSRLFACAGINGDVHFRDSGDPDWSFDFLFGQVAAGLESEAAIWTGSSWLVGTNIGVFRSSAGQSPWTYTDFGLHQTIRSSFAIHEGVVFTHFASGEGTGIEYSTDDGAIWTVLDALPATFTYEIASIGSMLYAGRVDGLWRRSIANVLAIQGGPAANLHFSIVGPNPIHEKARFQVVLPRAGQVRIDIFDLAGRHVPGGIDQTLPAGASDVTWQAGSLAPGLYMARLHAGGRTSTVRLVRLR